VVAAGSAGLEAARVEAGAAEQRRQALEGLLRAAQAEGGELRGQLLQVGASVSPVWPPACLTDSTGTQAPGQDEEMNQGGFRI
jgi:hypothetical protein